MINNFVLDWKKALKLFAVFAGVFVGVFLLYKIAHYVAPFIIAFAIASLMEPIIKFMQKRLGISRKFAAPIVLVVVLAILATVLTLLVTKLVNEIISFIYVAPDLFTSLYNKLQVLLDEATKLYQWLPADISQNLQGTLANLSTSLVALTKQVGKGAYQTAISIPEAIIFTIITILATYFISSDREKISVYFYSQLPQSWVNRVRSIRTDMFSALFGYIRAQLIMMSITFTELFIGFNIIHIKYTLLLAVLIALIDALPVLGTGGVLIPWALFSFITGDMRMGISLLILYFIVLIVRQLIEPKVLGHQIGVYPLLTLMAMYGGLKLVGVVGLILGPITFLLLKNIFSGIIHDRSIKDILNKD